MIVKNNTQTTSALNLLLCKCPRCRKGDMFEEKNPYNLKRFMQMHRQCPVCGQELDLEVGFYYGSSYVSYAITLAFSAATLIIWWFTIGVSLNDNRIFYWLFINSAMMLALQPVFMRMARTLWLAFFVRYEKNWHSVLPKKPERINEQLMDAW